MACQLYSREMASYVEEDFQPSNTIRKEESRQKKKKSKKRKNKTKDQEESSLCFSYSPDHHSKNINDAEKKKKHKKKKDKSTIKDKSTLQPSRMAHRSKKCKLPHEVIVKSKTHCHPIKPLELEGMNKPKAVKCVTQDIGKARPKKRVLFDLSPKGSVIKKYGDARQFCPKTSFVDAVEDHNPYAPTLQAVQDCVESPGSTEGLDSQDLFITQNTFLSPSLFQVPSDDDLKSTPELRQAVSQQARSEKLRATFAFTSTVEAATQTENFFTSPKNSTFLNFQLSKVTKCTEQPIDLSLPHRQQGQKSTCIMKESDQHHHGKTDLTHINFVQMRLNESFFFKMKGEEESPKPQYPLKKLKDDYGKKHKK